MMTLMIIIMPIAMTQAILSVINLMRKTIMIQVNPKIS